MENIFKGEDNQKISKVLILIGVLLSLFLIVKTVNALREYKFIGINPANPPSITVSGEGEVFAVPNVAEFTFTVMEEAKTAGEAQPKVNTKVESVLKALKESGIEDKDIKTLSYDVYPKYQSSPVICREYGCPPSNQQIVGYQVSQTIQVKVKDVKKANLVLGDLGKLNVSNLSNLTLTVDDEDILMEEAREKAISEARSKAEKLAQDLGVDLGKIISFNENGNTPIYYGTAKLEVAQDAATSNPNIPVGQNKIVSHVSLVFEIR